MVELVAPLQHGGVGLCGALEAPNGARTLGTGAATRVPCTRQVQTGEGSETWWLDPGRGVDRSMID